MAVPTKFDDGGAYELMMGQWSRQVGEIFLDWLAPERGGQWVDVACGNGAFTELLVERCQPIEIHGVDISNGMLAYARTRHSAGLAKFHEGEAQSLPFSDGTFDVAAMALAINLMPEPDRVVAEMMRVVRSGGMVGTYMWDIPGGGITMEPIRHALDEMGVATPIFGAENTRLERMRELWETAGLKEVEVRRIEIRPTFGNFDDFWNWNVGPSNTITRAIAELSPDQVDELKQRLQRQLSLNAASEIVYDAFANAVKGLVP